MSYTFLTSFSTFLELPSGLSVKRADCLIAHGIEILKFLCNSKLWTVKWPKEVLSYVNEARLHKNPDYKQFFKKRYSETCKFMSRA